MGKGNEKGKRKVEKGKGREKDQRERQPKIFHSS